MPPKKIRLDELLAGRELAAGPKEAAAMIMAGLVYSGTRRLDKPGEQVDPGIMISVKSKEHPYVSRGGLKLAHALGHFGLEVRGLRCLDLGSSTGGFSDCMLQAGAASVTAVDAGTNQLDWKLRKDPRVRVMEQCDARTLTPEGLGGLSEFAALDLSFIRLESVLPLLPKLLKGGAFWVALIKPQFEAARHEVPEGGVVVDREVQARVCDEVRDCARALGLGPLSVIESPITGRDGNIEFLIVGQIEKVIQT